MWGGLSIDNLALNIIFFQFYGSNVNGRFNVIASMTVKQGNLLADKLYALSAMTMCVKSLGWQMITVTALVAENLSRYQELLRPPQRSTIEDHFFLRFNGNPFQGDDASKSEATMTDKLFGLFLPVTTLRGINNTAVKVRTKSTMRNAKRLTKRVKDIVVRPQINPDAEPLACRAR